MIITSCPAPAGYAPRKFLRRDPERVRLPALLRSRRCDQHSNIGHGYYATPPANGLVQPCLTSFGRPDATAYNDTLSLCFAEFGKPFAGVPAYQASSRSRAWPG